VPPAAAVDGVIEEEAREGRAPVPITLTLGALAAFVAWERQRKPPILLYPLGSVSNRTMGDRLRLAAACCRMPCARIARIRSDVVLRRQRAREAVCPREGQREVRRLLSSDMVATSRYSPIEVASAWRVGRAKARCRRPRVIGPWRRSRKT
jgi:hypothetical protein